jgi:hypothetical protein
MTIMILAGLLLGVTGPVTALEHRVAVEHRGGTVDAAYRAELSIHHRQVGSVSAPGRASTLRCQWRADLDVARDARHAAGSAGRALRRQGVATGSRAGWCGAHREAIAREVAGRADEWRRHMLAVAEEDRADLLAEIDRLHDDRRG